MRPCGSLIYLTHKLHQKIHQLELGFCLFSLLRRHRSLLHPERRHAPANGRASLRKSGVAAYHRLRRRLLHSVRTTIVIPSVPFVFPKAKTQYVYCCLICFSIMFLLRLATSMIGMFMLVLIMFMIYLFWNLIRQLPNYSTVRPKSEVAVKLGAI